MLGNLLIRWAILAVAIASTATLLADVNGAARHHCGTDQRALRRRVPLDDLGGAHDLGLLGHPQLGIRPSKGAARRVAREVLCDRRRPERLYPWLKDHPIRMMTNPSPTETIPVSRTASVE
jgi:hypothetical protein